MTVALRPAGSIVSGGPFSVFGESGVVHDDSATYIVPSGDAGGYEALTLIITGTLTAQRNLQLPLHLGRPWIIRNATTGGFAIVVLGPSGTGITVSNGSSILVYNNGTNFYSAGAAIDLASPGPIGGTTPDAITTTQINMSGGIFWNSNHPPDFGTKALNFSSDADINPVPGNVYNGVFQWLVSSATLTQVRKAVYPLTHPGPYVFRNNTTGGKSITIIGATGTGFDLENGGVAVAICDGTNFYRVRGEGGIDSLELIAGDARTASGTLDATKNNHPQDSSSGIFTLTIADGQYVGERHVVTDWGGAIETNPITVTTGSATKIQHPLTGSRAASSFSFGSTNGVGFRNGSTFELQWTGTLWMCLR